MIKKMKSIARYTFILVITLLMTLPVSGQIIPEIDGFRNNPFGTAFEDIEFFGPEKLVKYDNDQNKKLYMLDQGDLSIGTAELENIFYEFNKKGLFKSVILEGDAAYNEDMEEILYYRLGNYHDQFIGAMETVRVWNTEKSLVVFREDRNKDFTVTIRSKVFDHATDLNKDISDF